MRRAYHHHDKWEDAARGMYKLTCKEQETLKKECEKLLKNPYMLHSFMSVCATFWTYAAEQNLSNPNRNRQAWLGQAACCYATGAPEFVTKMAWRELTAEERVAANAVADEIIEEWEFRYAGYGKQTTIFG